MADIKKAMQWLQSGKKIKLSDWSFFHIQLGHFHKIDKYNNGHLMDSCDLNVDIFRDDWELCEDQFVMGDIGYYNCRTGRTAYVCYKSSDAIYHGVIEGYPHMFNWDDDGICTKDGSGDISLNDGCFNITSKVCEVED